MLDSENRIELLLRRTRIMPMSPKSLCRIDGLPTDLSPVQETLMRTRLSLAFAQIQSSTRSKAVSIVLSAGNPPVDAHENAGSPRPGNAPKDTQRSISKTDEVSAEERAECYKAIPPSYVFEQLVLPDGVKSDILDAVSILALREKLFEIWNLNSIEPYPRAALNFHGPSGTGKTLAAHAIASHLGKNILEASYAEIESMYHGEGPKNVKAIFEAAERDNAVLFIDEADSLLSRRLTNVTQGSEQAINSMRSQIFISLQQFSGIVIFATNLVQNYDTAFETRVSHIAFTLPDRETRQQIWLRHLPAELPLASDVTADRLSEINDLCGRDIKNTVVAAAIAAARRGDDHVSYADLERAANRIKSSRTAPATTPDEQLAPAEEARIQALVEEALGDPPQPA